MMETEAASDRHWTLDAELQRYFLSAAVVCWLLVVVGVLANLFSWNEGGLPFALRVVGGLIAAFAVVPVLFLWLSMLSYWWQSYRSEHGMSWFWLILLVAGNWVGATIFYFVVFRQIAERRN